MSESPRYTGPDRRAKPLADADANRFRDVEGITRRQKAEGVPFEKMELREVDEVREALLRELDAHFDLAPRVPDFVKGLKLPDGIERRLRTN